MDTALVIATATVAALVFGGGLWAYVSRLPVVEPSDPFTPAE